MLQVKRIIYAIAWLVLIVYSKRLIAQSDYVIEEIHFEGLKKTKVSYLQTFLETSSGQVYNDSLLQEDLQRLINLIPVTNATYRLDTIGTKINLIFNIDESLTLFPIANFGGVRGNFWYQLGFTDANLLGEGMILNVYYQNNDERDNFNIYYRYPALSGSPWGFSVGLLRFASVEPLYFDDGQRVFYDYTNTNINATGIYRLGVDQFLEVGGTFFIEDYNKNSRHAGEMTPGPGSLREPKILTKYMHSFQRLKYHYFYLWGFYNKANYQMVYSLREYTWFHIFLNDTRYYRRIGKTGNFASRLRIGISTNNNTPFAPFVLDSYVNIRGAGNRVDRGTAALILNLEYRQTVFDMNPFAAQVIAFSDAGTWRNPGGDFSDLTDRDNFRHFVGGGIRLIYKKAFNTILRIDYGVDLYNLQQRGAVIGIGQYF